MNKFINNLKFNIAAFFKSAGYLKYFTEQVYKTYLNHNKIIHHRDGYPVYSLATPALFSRPAANFFVRLIYRVVQNRNIPNLMSFAVNDACNANCKHCSFFEGVDDKTKKVMTIGQCKKLIKDAQKLGVSIINFVGGEPLLRDDLPEIIKSVDKDLSTVILFTNGLLLSEKVGDLKSAGVDGVYVSIDSADEKKHDDIRGRKGIFKKAMEGIAAAKNAGLSVGISCCIDEDAFRGGELEKIIELGKKIGVHEILIFDAIPTGRLKKCNSLIDGNDWIEELIDFTEQYNSNYDYPGILVYSYATSYRSTGCSGGTSYFYVSPYGDISPCDFNHVTFGNILKEPLYKIWDKMSSINIYKQATWGGCKMKNSNYRSSEYVSSGCGYKDVCKSCDKAYTDK